MSHARTRSQTAGRHVNFLNLDSLNIKAPKKIAKQKPSELKEEKKIEIKEIEPKEKASKESEKNHYTPALQAYIDTFKDKPKRKDELKKLKLSPQEEKRFDDFICSLSLEVFEIPVNLHGKIYDLNTLLKYTEPKDGVMRTHPESRRQFYLNEIAVELNYNNSIDNIISDIRKQRNQPRKCKCSSFFGSVFSVFKGSDKGVTGLDDTAKSALRSP